MGIIPRIIKCSHVWNKHFGKAANGRYNGLQAAQQVRSDSVSFGSQQLDTKHTPLHVYCSVHPTTEHYKKDKLTFMYLVNIWSKKKVKKRNIKRDVSMH